MLASPQAPEEVVMLNGGASVLIFCLVFYTL